MPEPNSVINATPLLADRYAAGWELSVLLKRFTHEKPLILVIPRGGAVVGKVIADALGWPMDLLLCKKVSHPDNPELAIGSVCADGTSMQTSVAETDGLDFNHRAEQLRQWLLARYQVLTGKPAPFDFRNKTVVITDDGLATGSTMLSAVRSARHAGAARVICAVPVSSLEAAHRVRQAADEFICPHLPENFDAIGQFYNHFPEITDHTVSELISGKPISTTNS